MSYYNRFIRRNPELKEKYYQRHIEIRIALWDTREEAEGKWLKEMEREDKEKQEQDKLNAIKWRAKQQADEKHKQELLDLAQTILEQEYLIQTITWVAERMGVSEEQLKRLLINVTLRDGRVYPNYMLELLEQIFQEE